MILLPSLICKAASSMLSLALLLSLRSIAKGKIIEMDDLTALRPGTGISSLKTDDIIGKKCTKEIKKDDPIISDNLI